MSEFESSWQQATSSKPPVTLHPIDAHQAEVLRHFCTLIDVPINDLSKTQLGEVSRLGAELESFAPKALSAKQRAGLEAFLRELRWSSNVIVDLQAKARSCHEFIEQASKSRALFSDHVEACKSLKQELADTMSLEESLEKQLKVVKEKKMLLQQQIASKSSETKAMMKAMTKSPSNLIEAQDNLARHEAQLDIYRKHWLDFSTLLRDFRSS